MSVVNFPKDRPIVCIQGLGFVGAAMAVAVAYAKGAQGTPAFNVIGIELPTPDGLVKINAINSGRLPFDTSDFSMQKALEEAHQEGNLLATTNAEAFSLADVTIVDIPFEVKDDARPALEHFRLGIQTIGKYIQPEALLLIETTILPGMSEKIVVPEIEASLEQRGLSKGSVRIAYSYERVMPGPRYLDSIINFWRVYAGHTVQAADDCRDFLSKVINVSQYPLTRLSSMTAAETAKILENSYRATTIAMMEEWRQFSEAIGINLFEIVEAIRLRPTHSNIRDPGFGVGGYCLTKDPLFAKISAEQIFHEEHLKFPFCESAVKINEEMPRSSLKTLEKLFGGALKGKTILVMGISYRSEVGDTRKSPSETFVRHARAAGAAVVCHDPYVKYWNEFQMELNPQLPPVNDLDGVVLVVGHPDYRELDFKKWFKESKPLILDTNNILSAPQITQLKENGCLIYSVGRGIIR